METGLTPLLRTHLSHPSPYAAGLTLNDKILMFEIVGNEERSGK